MTSMSASPYGQTIPPGHHGPPETTARLPHPAAQPSSNDPAELLLHYFPEAAKLSREDMEEMLRSPAYFDAFFGTLPQVLDMYKEHEDLLRRNEELTAKNLALRERHEALRHETQGAFNDARGLEHRWHNEVSPAQEDVYKRFAANVQLSRLRTASSDQDRLSEQLIKSLQDGELDMDDFSRQYKEVRRLYYRRSLQTEKFEKGQVEWTA